MINNESERTPVRTKDSKKLMLWIIIVLAALIVGLAVWFIVTTTQQKKAIEEAIALKEAAELDAGLREVNESYDELNREFAEFESQRQLILDDSVKRDLTAKYENARLQIENLQQQLRDQRNLSAAEIQRLKDEIATLRNLLKHYVEEINRLKLENQSLRDENAEIRDNNRRLSTQVEETSRQNEQLSERMTLAEKLNVTGVSFALLNKKGKVEKKLKNAKKIRVTFTIPQNNSTPVGEKTIYLQIWSPSAALLPGGGTFTFEGVAQQCTAQKTIEYAGEEIGGIEMYWDVTTALSSGTYTVRLFADNYQLVEKTFEVK